MKRNLLTIGLLICLGFQSTLWAGGPKRHKETSADMSGAKSVFIGWVDLSPDQWALWGYSGKDEWAEVIKGLDVGFQGSCQGYLESRTVTAAKDRTDENPAGNDLYVKFSGVSIDGNSYGIRLAIQFIDPKTNAEIAFIPSRLYYEKREWKFQRYLQAALEDIAKKVAVEVTGTAPKK